MPLDYVDVERAHEFIRQRYGNEGNSFEVGTLGNSHPWREDRRWARLNLFPAARTCYAKVEFYSQTFGFFPLYAPGNERGDHPRFVSHYRYFAPVVGLATDLVTLYNSRWIHGDERRWITTLTPAMRRAIERVWELSQLFMTHLIQGNANEAERNLQTLFGSDLCTNNGELQTQENQSP